MPSELEVFQLLESGIGFDEINKQLGINCAKIYYQNGLRKMTQAELLKSFPMVAIAQRGTEEKSVSDENISEAKFLGIPDGILKQLNKRIAARKGTLVRESSRKLSEKDTIDQLERKLHLALEYLDDFSFSASSAKDLAGVIDVLINNIQLLKGKPTQIMTIDDRRKLNELIPALIIEAQRRGVTLPMASITAEFTRES